MSDIDPRSCLVIGAGPAGLAAAAALERAGFDVDVIEREPQLGASWRGHYDRLHLHTPRHLSGLPGLGIPRAYGKWVSRDDLVRYLETYAREHGLRIETGVEARSVARERHGWTVDCGPAGVRRARRLVIATGYNREQRLPEVPGLEGFEGELVRSADYRSGEPFRGRDVLVVGTGNTGMEIAVDLVEHGAASVALAVRTPPHIVRRQVGPVAAQRTGILIRRLPPRLVDPVARLLRRLTVGDLREHGLPEPERGLLDRAARDHAIPVQDVGIVDAVRSGAVRPVAALAAVEGADAVLADGERLRPDAIVLAAGYRQALEPLLGGLGLLDERGRPVMSGGRTAPGAPGLWAIGFTNPISGMLREIAIDARRIARAAARETRR